MSDNDRIDPMVIARGIELAERKRAKEYAVVNAAITVLAEMCAGDHRVMIDLLTGHLWTDEEADGLKHAIPQAQS